jgi:O-antigen ligase
MRAYSTFGQPNSYGHYLAGIVPLSLGLLLHRRAYGVFFAIATVALLLTGSRGAIAATLLAVLVMVLLLQLRSRSRAIVGMSVSVAVAATAFALLPRAFFGNVLSLGDWSVQQRALALLTTWRGITSRPVLGFGAGSFKAVVSDIRVPGLVDDIEMPHNMLLDIWFEVGLLAILCFCALLFLYYRAVIRAYKRSGDGILLALLGAFTGLIAASMFGTLVVRGIGELLALIIGMTAGRIAWLKRAAPRPGERRTRARAGGPSVSKAIAPPT